LTVLQAHLGGAPELLSVVVPAALLVLLLRAGRHRAGEEPGPDAADGTDAPGDPGAPSDSGPGSPGDPADSSPPADSDTPADPADSGDR
jgi:hypothetical protein